MQDKNHFMGDLPFNERSPLLAQAVGVGYLKEPLRYLTGDDLQVMGMRTQQFSRASSTKNGEKLDFGGNNLGYIGIPRVSLHGSSKNTWGKLQKSKV